MLFVMPTLRKLCPAVFKRLRNGLQAAQFTFTTRSAAARYAVFMSMHTTTCKCSILPLSGCAVVLGQDQAHFGDQARAGQLWAGV